MAEEDTSWLTCYINFERHYPEDIFQPLKPWQFKVIGFLIGPRWMSRLHAGWARHLAEVARQDAHRQFNDDVAQNEAAAKSDPRTWDSPPF